MVDLAEGGLFLETMLEKMTEAHLASLQAYLPRLVPTST